MTSKDPTPQEVVEANIALHSSMATSYNEREPHFRPENLERVRGILKGVADRANGGKLIDFGCGTGFIINLAKDLFETIDGVDITQAMLDQVDTSSGNITLHNHVCESVPFEDNSFDVATAYSFIDHTADYSLILKEAARVLKPGGIAYIDLVPNAAFWNAIWMIEASGVETTSPHVLREINALLHQHSDVEKEFGLEEGTFLIAEPSKSQTRGLDDQEVIAYAKEFGMSEASVEPHWFIGQGPVMHERSFDEADAIDRHLRAVLPASLHMFKYLRFFFVK